MKVDLVKFKPEYFEDFMRWRRQASSLAHNPLRDSGPSTMFRSLCDAPTDLGILAQNPTNFDESYCFRWFIQLEGGEIVGVLSFRGISMMMGYGEIGYMVSEEYQRKGIATAAITEFLRRVFSETPMRRIMAVVHDKNLASLRVLEKIGFQREGLLREHFIINGRLENEVMLAILKHEFLKA